MSSVESRVIATIARHFRIEEHAVTLDSSLTHDLGSNSLDIVELLMAFEDEFGVEIEDEAAEAITTVGSAVECIRAIGERRRRP
jgi:acyl carrier protein